MLQDTDGQNLLRPEPFLCVCSLWPVLYIHDRGPLEQSAFWQLTQTQLTPIQQYGMLAGRALRCTRQASVPVANGLHRLHQTSIASHRCSGYLSTRAFGVPRSRAAVRAMATAGQKAVLVPIGTGSEEMEAVITIDVLRRAGAAVTVASVEPQLEVTCSRGVKIVADKLITDAATEAWDLIACPGGMPGAERLRDSEVLVKLLQDQAAAGKLHAAICATPAVMFEPQGLLKGKRATAHPAFEGKLSDQSAVKERVVVDGQLTTSKGPGTAFEFALSLVGQLYGEEKAAEVAGPMVLK